MVELAAGLTSSAFLLFLAASLSPDWRRRKGLWRSRFENDIGAARLAVASSAIVLGIPASLGLVAGNLLWVLGALLAATASRDSAPARNDPLSGPWAPFVVLSWSLLAAGFCLGTFDLGEMLATQAVLGPAALVRGSWMSVLACLAFAAGVFWSALWLRDGHPAETPSPSAAADTFLGWGRTALAGAALSSLFFGPSLGALTSAPVSAELGFRALGSVLGTCSLVAALSLSRRVRVTPGKALQGLTAAASLTALVAAALSR